MIHTGRGQKNVDIECGQIVYNNSTDFILSIMI